MFNDRFSGLPSESDKTNLSPLDIDKFFNILADSNNENRSLPNSIQLTHAFNIEQLMDFYQQIQKGTKLKGLQKFTEYSVGLELSDDKMQIELIDVQKGTIFAFKRTTSLKNKKGVGIIHSHPINITEEVMDAYITYLNSHLCGGVLTPNGDILFMVKNPDFTPIPTYLARMGRIVKAVGRTSKDIGVFRALNAFFSLPLPNNDNRKTLAKHLGNELNMTTYYGNVLGNNPTLTKLQ